MAVDDLVLPADPVASLPWWDRATRWTQLTFVEDDPLHFDLDAWVEVMKQTKSNALCLSAGGYIAFYPTQLPHHHRSVHLGDRDIFGDLVEAARGLGMSIMARVDPHAIHAEAAMAHPEWLARDEHGQPMPHWAFPGIWLTDVFSSYHREFITEVAREIVTNYDVDAVFANRWEGSAYISYSDAARHGFRAATGLDLPSMSNLDDPAWSTFGHWRSRQLSELVVRWDEAVQAVRPDVRFIPNRGMLLTRDLDRELVDSHYPAFFIDKQGRNRDEAAWAAGRIGKRSRGMFPDRPVSLITSVGPEHHIHRWKDSVASAAETRHWIVQGFAQGANPWFTKFNAVIADPRWIEPVSEAFSLHAETEQALAGMGFTSDVVILDSVRLDHPKPLAGYVTTNSHEDGFYQALLEARIPFEYLSDQELSLERLAPDAVLVLPNCSDLSDAMCEVITAHVARGGAVVAAHESSLRDASGTPRSDFGLADVLGVSLGSPVRGPVKNNYVELASPHEVSDPFRPATRVIGGTRLIEVTASADAVVPFTFLPDFPDLPMEEVYPRGGAGTPAVVLREHPSGGRTAYAAFDLGDVFWDAMQADHAQMIRGLVEWARGRRGRVEVTGVGLIDLAVREADNRLAITVVNLNNPMTMRGQFREVSPLPPQNVSIAIPAGCAVLGVEALYSGQILDHAVVDGRLQLVIGGFDVIETVMVTWRKGGVA